MADRKRLTDEAISRGYLDAVCEGEKFDFLVNDLARLLPAGVNRNAFRTSIEHLAGDRLTRHLLSETMWRIAGNLRRLSHAPWPAVPPWSTQPAQEWVPVQILQARRKRGGRGDPGWLFTFQVLAGTSCPLRLTKFWSDRFCNYMTSLLGFSRRRISEKSSQLPRFRFHHSTELVTLRLYALIDPAMCTLREPGFEQTKVPPSCVAWNREQMAYRDRFEEKYKCRFSMPDTLMCFKCPKGYQNCRAGTHRLDYTFDFCTYCGRQDAAYDAALSNEMCIDCHNKRALARE